MTPTSRLSLIATAVLALLGLAGTASAHTVGDVVAVPAGGQATVTLQPGHGCGGSPTVAVSIRAPVRGATAGEVDGWSASAVEDEDGTVLEWRGGVLPTDGAGRFPVTFTVPDTPGQLLTFPAVQTCEHGEELAWIDADPTAEHPAPRLLVLPAGSAPAATVDEVPPDAPGREQLAEIVDVDDPTGGDDDPTGDDGGAASTDGGSDGTVGGGEATSGGGAGDQAAGAADLTEVADDDGGRPTAIVVAVIVVALAAAVGVVLRRQRSSRGGMTLVPSSAPPRPVSLRPMAALDIVDGAFAVLRQRPRTLITVILPVLVPLKLLQAWLSRDILGGVGLAELWADPTLADEGAATGVSVLPVLADMAATSFTVSVSGVAVAHVMVGWMDGREVSAGQALRSIARRWWVVLGAWLVVRVVQGLASSLFVVPGLVAVVLLSVTSPVLAFEGRGPLAAARRSASLVRPRLGPVLAVVLLTGVVSYGVAQAIESLPATVALLIGPSRAWPLLAASGILSSLVVVPFVASSACLVYLDLRFRSEGLDLELEAAEVLPGDG